MGGGLASNGRRTRRTDIDMVSLEIWTMSIWGLPVRLRGERRNDMEFMLLIVDRKGAPAGEPPGMAEMGKFAGELAQQGKIRGGAPLRPEATGARVRVRDGKAVATDGPFAESREVIGGSFVIEAESRAAAIEIPTRCPHARAGLVEGGSL